MAIRRRRGELTGTSLDNKAAGSDIMGADTAGIVVKEYQGLLIELGYLPAGSDTGRKDATTIAAIKKFQKEHPPLSVDGDVGPMTLGAMKAAVAAKRATGVTTQSFVDTSKQPTSTDLMDYVKKTMEQTPMGQQPTGQQPTFTQPSPTMTVPGYGAVNPSQLPGLLADLSKQLPGGAYDMTKLPTGVPGVPGVPGTPGTQGTPGTTQPSGAPPTGSAAAADDKILGIPKNYAIGGGIALGVLALVGIYMMTRKDEESESQAQRASKYTDDLGQRWTMDEYGTVFPEGSESLSERAHRIATMHHRSHPRHMRRLGR